MEKSIRLEGFNMMSSLCDIGVIRDDFMITCIKKHTDGYYYSFLIKNSYVRNDKYEEKLNSLKNFFKNVKNVSEKHLIVPSHAHFTKINKI